MTIDKNHLGKAAKLMLERETLVAMSFKLGNQRASLHMAPSTGGSEGRTVALEPQIARKFVMILLEENQEALHILGVSV